jgi:long-chain acyl-CoA synthetase
LLKDLCTVAVLAGAGFFGLTMDFPRISYKPLPHHVAAHALARPGHPAIVDGDVMLDYAGLDDRIRRGAAKLRKMGVRKGDRVIIVAAQKTDLMLGTLACMGAGAPVAPLSPTEENIESLARYFNPALVILGDNLAPESLPGKEFRTLPLTELFEAGPDELAELAYEDIGLFILTSGTTGGQRRGAMISYRSLSGTAEYMNERMGITPDIRELITAPLEHAFGMGRVKCALHAGGTAIFTPSLFSPKIIVGELARHACNTLSGVVSALGLVLDSEAAALSALAGQIRWIELGSGQFSLAHWRALSACLPNTRCFMSYGLTEARRSTFLEYNADPRKGGTVGKPTRWVSVRIVNDSNEPMGPNEVGRIQIDGVNKASGYYDYPEAWQKKQCGEWLDTGDHGVLDEDGYLTYVGRIDDTINVGGLKVAPEEVEMELRPLLKDLPYAVARVPDPLGIEGHVPALFIESKTDRGLTIDDVREHLRPLLPAFKIPRLIYCVDAIPRTSATKKIRRGALAPLALEQERARLPKTTALLGALRQAPWQNWPAFAGSETLLRKNLQSTLTRNGALPRDAQLGAATAWLRQVVKDDDFDLGQLIRQCEELFPSDAKSAVAIGLAANDIPIAQALQWRTLAKGGACLLLRPLAQSRIAEDLGWITRCRAAYVLLDRDRFARLAAAEAHLSDAFDFPEFQHAVIVGPEPGAADLVKFRGTFNIDPQHLTCLGTIWSLRTLRPKLDSADIVQSEEIWRILRDTAAGIFHVQADKLHLDSSTENTPGWNSLGYLQLVMAVEEAFGRTLAPRDIMAVRQLRDLVGILGNTQP